MPKKIAILQSNYIPWKGYFDLINQVDEFIIYDDVQYTKNDWRNRNRIKTPQGVRWLTIPVRQEKLSQTIRETKISDPRWPRKHWVTISQCYSKAQYFKDYRDVFEQVYQLMDLEYLSEINYRFMSAINGVLGIETRLRWSSEFELLGDQTERLLGICRQCGASEYLSGPAAKSYLDLEMAAREKIQISWLDYSGYPDYPQLYPPFEHGVTILDLIFNTGPHAANYMKSF